MSSAVQIILRTVTLVILLVALIYGYQHYVKKQRKAKVVAELSHICGESAFYRQFSADDARKTLIRAIGLLAEAESLGMGVDEAIKGGLGIETGWFDDKPDPDDMPISQKIVRDSLRSNYDNFIKLGYQPVFDVFYPMKEGDLVQIPEGPLAGRKPVIRTLIPEEASPGIEKVIANLELAPPGTDEAPMTDLQFAAAKQLTRNLVYARLIEEPVAERIIAYLDRTRTSVPDKS
ncbi:MAG TPA: hypothetical protein VLO11_00510 [Luteolibacter sp.]|nr:hypothetical protein [Luteolibacter sp.]